MASDLLGVAMAGGASRRMGRDKASLPAGAGGTFLGHAVSLLEGIGLDCVVSCSPERPYSGYALVPDAVAGQGPARGILTCLEYAAARGYGGILALACDLPAMRSEPLVQLVERHHARPDWAHATVYHSAASKKREMLCAAYAASASGLFRLGLENNIRAVIRLIPENICQILTVPPDWLFMFLNCNEPGDMGALDKGGAWCR